MLFSCLLIDLIKVSYVFPGGLLIIRYQYYAGGT
jgi:hypothetical protein